MDSSMPATSSSPMLMPASRKSAEKTVFATERARLLLGQFRRGEANDPATFITSIAAVLARYSWKIITSVTDPRTGLASKTDWLPTIREVCVACDRLAETENSSLLREKAIQEQYRRRIEDEKPRSSDEIERVRRKLQEVYDARDRAEGRQTAAEQRLEAEATLARFLAEANAGPSARAPLVISDELRKQIGLRLAAE